MAKVLHGSSWLSTFLVGERRYVETTLETYAADMRRINTPKSRRPEKLSGVEFHTTLFTCVSCRAAKDVRRLICIERVK